MILCFALALGFSDPALELSTTTVRSVSPAWHKKEKAARPVSRRALRNLGALSKEALDVHVRRLYEHHGSRPFAAAIKAWMGAKDKSLQWLCGSCLDWHPATATHCKWSGDLTKYKLGLSRALAESSSKGKYPIIGAAIGPSKGRGHQLLKKDAVAIAPWKKDAAATTTSAAAPKPAAEPKKDADQLPMDLVDIEREKQDMEKKLKAITDHAAKRLLEQEEEDAAEEANAISTAKSDEVAKLHMQLKWEQGYLSSMADAVGQEAEERTAVLE